MDEDLRSNESKSAQWIRSEKQWLIYVYAAVWSREGAAPCLSVFLLAIQLFGSVNQGWTIKDKVLSNQRYTNIH